jgi:anti-sigma regulatory factor (Ser/Thr protein kinase)
MSSAAARLATPPRPDSVAAEPPDRPWQYGLQMPNDPRAAGVARATVATVLRSHGADALTETAQLLVSELVTNALRYSRGHVLLRMRWTDGLLRVTVRDTSHRPPVPADAPVGVHRTRGRGLFLVRRLAHRWGHYDFAPSSGGKAVWFELLHTSLACG